MLAILWVLVIQKTVDLLLVLLVGLAETHIFIIPLLFLAYSLLKKESPRSFSHKEERIRPSLLGKIKMLFYVCSFLILIVGRMIDSAPVLAVGIQILKAGIVIAFLALAQYIFRWIRNLY